MEVKISCTGSGMMPLNQIIPLQGGLKDLSDANYRKLKNQILTHGMVSPFMIWEGRCIDGHQRLRTLLKMKEEGILMPESFPKVDIEAPDIKSAKRILLAISSQYGKLTGDGLYEYMQDMEIDIPEMRESFEFDSLDFGDFEKEYFDENPGTIEGEDSIPEDAPTISKLGDIWHLGNHKIMCGDCTVEENVKRLMGEEKADMIFSDPPYGVDYEGIANDSREGLSKLLMDSFKAMVERLNPGAPVYIFHSDRCADIFHNIFRKYFHFSSMIIWNKNSLTLSQTDYQSKHEPILYGWMEGGPHNFYGDRKELSVWDFEKTPNPNHPTSKPVGIIEKALKNSSEKGDMVIDCFLGSGSTLIACEKTNRKCYSMEISPMYVDVAVKRFADFTHQSDNIYLERDGEKIPYSTLVDLNPIL